MKEDQEIVALCSKAAETALRIVSLLTKKAMADISALVSDFAECLQTEGNNKTSISPAQAGSSVRQCETKIEAGREKIEIFIVKDGNGVEQTMENRTAEVPEADESSEDDNTDAPDDVVMPNVNVVKVVSTRHLPSSKELPLPSSFEGVGTNDYVTLGSDPCLDVEDLGTEGFVDDYATDGWLPGDLPL